MADGRWRAFGKLWGGGALILVAAFMFLGFLVSGGPFLTPLNLFVLLVTVGIPGATGGALVASHFRRGERLTARQEALRLETIEAEVIRLAGRRDGRLTAVEVAGELGIPVEDAKRTLDALMLREVADIEVTDSGVLVYTFHEVRHLEDKAGARPLLEDAPDRGFDIGGDPRRERREDG